IGGTTQTVVMPKGGTGWTFNALDQGNDEGSAEGAGTSTCPNPLPPTTNTPYPPAGCDIVNVGVPVDGAWVYESPGGCLLEANASASTPAHTTPLAVDTAASDNTTLQVVSAATGTNTASQIPVFVAA